MSKLGVLTCPAKFAVEIRFNKLGVDTSPERAAVLTYPACPSPPTVDASCAAKKVVEIRFDTVEASSFGSMNVLTNVCRPIVVETRLEVFTREIPVIELTCN